MYYRYPKLYTSTKCEYHSSYTELMCNNCVYYFWFQTIQEKKHIKKKNAEHSKNNRTYDSYSSSLQQ